MIENPVSLSVQAIASALAQTASTSNDIDDISQHSKAPSVNEQPTVVPQNKIDIISEPMTSVNVDPPEIQTISDDDDDCCDIVGEIASKKSPKQKSQEVQNSSRNNENTQKTFNLPPGISLSRNNSTSSENVKSEAVAPIPENEAPSLAAGLAATENENTPTKNRESSSISTGKKKKKKIVTPLRRNLSEVRTELKLETQARIQSLNVANSNPGEGERVKLESSFGDDEKQDPQIVQDLQTGSGSKSVIKEQESPFLQLPSDPGPSTVAPIADDIHDDDDDIEILDETLEADKRPRKRVIQLAVDDGQLTALRDLGFSVFKQEWFYGKRRFIFITNIWDRI